MKSVAVTVGTTAVQVGSGGAWINQKNVLIQCISAGPVYVGGNDVTTTNGISIIDGDSLAVDLLGEDVWCISANTNTNIRVLRSGE